MKIVHLSSKKLTAQANHLILFGLALMLGACNTQSTPAPIAPPAVTVVAAPSTQEPSPTPTNPDPAADAVTPTPGPSANPGTVLIPNVAPQEAVFSQLTSGGCCVQPFWSPDSQKVLFLDRPDPSTPAGFYSVSLTGGTPQLWTDRLGQYSPDLTLRAFPKGGITVIERLADGMQWNLANGGRPVSFSPDGQYVAWTGGQDGPPFDTARRQVWIAQTDGTGRRVIFEMTGGSLSGWLPDGRALVTGRLPTPDNDQVLWAVPLPARREPAGNISIQPIELARADRLRNLAISPGGSRLVYMVTQSEDPSEAGLWMVEVNTGRRQRVEPFGAYRWRDDQRLVIAPLESGAPSHRLIEINFITGMQRSLTMPDQTPFKIANGDWSISPDGRWAVFLSAADQNLWLIALPE